MKQLYLLFFVTCISIMGVSQPVLPVDFETPVTFEAFGGGLSTVVANAHMNTDNPSAKVGQMVKSNGEGWGGSWFALAAPINLELGKIFKMKVYSPRSGIKILMKLENMSDGSIFKELEVVNTVAAGWEELTYDFSSINTANSYQKIVLIFDNGNKGDGSANFTFWYDDIKQVAGGGGSGLTQMNLPVTFDAATVDYGLVGFGGAEGSTIVTDPTDAANKVAKVIKTAAAELWAGTTVTAAAGLGFSSKIPFTATDRKMTVRVWSPDANIKVRLKVEDHTDGNKSVETEALTTVANGWQTLEFDFNNNVSGTAAFNAGYNYDKASIFFNFGVTGAAAGEKTYYFDDVKMAAGGGGGGLMQMNLPVSFDAANVDYGLLGFGGAEGSTIVTDPTDAANKVAKVIKTAAAELWAGTTVTAAAGLGFSSKIPFTATDRKMTVRVWSPDANIKVRLKVEDHTDGSKSVETEALTTVANGWQTLEFDFNNNVSGTAAFNAGYNYDKASIFFNFGVTGAAAGEKTYYFDDVKMAAGGGGLMQMNLPVSFDAANVDYGLIGFGGAEGSTIVTDPTDAANKVAKVIKTAAAELWAGTTVTAAAGLGFSSKIPFTSGNKKMTVRVWSPDANIKVRLKVEDHTDGNKSVETEALTTVANGWQTLEFDFNNNVSGTAAFNAGYNYDKASIFFNFGVTGAAAGEKTYYFDDLKMGVGAVLTQMNLPVSFDAANVDYGLVGFEGAEASTIETDPTDAANKVAKVIKSNTAQFYAGTTVTAVTNNVQTGFSAKIPFTILNRKMSVRVWSPDANIKVRLKVEASNDPTKSVETQVVNTVAGGWETLVFDFGTQAPGTAALNLSYNYNKATIFFNFDVTGAVAGTKTYYFDDLQFGVTLPVSLITFNVAKTDNKAVLTWSTASETNNKGFSVQRSSNAQTWSEIGFVKGAGNSAAVNNYVYTDAKPAAGISYYRLVQVDFDGNSKQSGIKAVNFGGTNKGISVYPNPAKNIVNIVSEVTTGKAVYRIVDVAGKTMLTGNVNAGSNIIPVNVSSLKAGTYMLLFSNDATVSNFKLLIL